MVSEHEILREPYESMIRSHDIDSDVWELSETPRNEILGNMFGSLKGFMYTLNETYPQVEEGKLQYFIGAPHSFGILSESNLVTDFGRTDTVELSEQGVENISREAKRKFSELYVDSNIESIPCIYDGNKMEGLASDARNINILDLNQKNNISFIGSKQNTTNYSNDGESKPFDIMVEDPFITLYSKTAEITEYPDQQEDFLEDLNKLIEALENFKDYETVIDKVSIEFYRDKIRKEKHDRLTDERRGLHSLDKGDITVEEFRSEYGHPSFRSDTVQSLEELKNGQNSQKVERYLEDIHNEVKKFENI